MLLEKNSRYVKTFFLTLSPRHKAASTLRVVDKSGIPSLLSVVRAAVRKGTAFRSLPNGDVIEVAATDHDAKRGVVTILFHRVRPNAPDPTYRKKNKAGLSVRKAQRDLDEDQSASAHLVISEKSFSPNRYTAVLEEVPGLSIGSIMPIISLAMREHRYDFKDSKGEASSSYTIVKYAGKQSETMEGALKKGRLNLVTLVRPAPSSMVDTSGLFKPKDQRLEVRIDRSLKEPKVLDRLADYIKRAREAGWSEFDVELEYEDERTKTVTLEREDEAKEVMFIRATQIHVVNDLISCATKPVDELIAKMAAIAKKG
jgi:hypothetical protein